MIRHQKVKQKQVKSLKYLFFKNIIKHLKKYVAAKL